MTKRKLRKQHQRERCSISEFPPSNTVQEDYTDIGQIVQTYKRTGKMPPLGGENAVYADVSGIQGKDLTELLNLQKEVQQKITEARATPQAEPDHQSSEHGISEVPQTHTPEVTPEQHSDS